MESIRESGSRSQSSVSKVREEDDGHSVDQDDSGNNGNQNKPEPEEDVNLLIDDVEGKNTEGIMLLDISWRPISMESTLCHPGKDFDHGVDSIHLISLRMSQDIQSIRRKSSSQEGIYDVHLTDDIDEVEDFAEYKVIKVTVMIGQVSLQVVNQQRNLICFLWLIHDGHL